MMRQRTAGRRTTSDTAPFLVGLLLLQVQLRLIASTKRQVPYTKVESALPSSVLFSTVSTYKTYYTFKVYGQPLPVYQQWYNREGPSSWENSNGSSNYPSPFHCSVLKNDREYREFQLVVDNPPKRFEGRQVSFKFSNEAGFILINFHLKEETGRWPSEWFRYIAVGVSSAVGLIVVVCIIVTVRACRRRCRRSKRRQLQAQRRQNVNADEQPPPQPPPAPSLNVQPAAWSLDLHPCLTPDHHHDPAPCPCEQGAGSRSRGYIKMYGEERTRGGADDDELAEAITSTLNRFRERARDNQKRIRRMSRSVPSLLSLHRLEDTSIPPARAQRRRILPARHHAATIGYGYPGRRARPPLPDVPKRQTATGPGSVEWDDDVVSDSASALGGGAGGRGASGGGGGGGRGGGVRSPPAGREDGLFRHCFPSEQADLDWFSDTMGEEEEDDEEEEDQRQSQNTYISMAVRGLRLPSNPEVLGAAALVNGPVYMNLMSLYDE